VTASLLHETSRLSAQVQEQQTHLSRHERVASQHTQEIGHLNSLVESRTAEKTSLQRSLQDAQNNLINSQMSHSADVTRLNERLQSLTAQLERLREEKSRFETEKLRFETENAALQTDLRTLHASNQEYQTFAGRARAKFGEQSRHIQDLEQMLSAAKASIPQSSQSIYQDRLAELRTKEELEAGFKAERSAMRQEIEALKNRLHSKEQENASLQSRVAAMHADLEDTKEKHEEAKGIIDAVQVDRDAMIEELGELKLFQSRLQTLVGEGITPRQILALKKFGASAFPVIKPEQVANSTRFLQTHRAEHLQAALFDLPLRRNSEVAAFVESISPGSSGAASLRGLRFQACPMCQRLKFAVSPPTAGSRNRRLNEFSGHFQQTACCSTAICSACLADSIKKSISADWWYNIASESWLKCPVEGCCSPMGIQRPDEIANILRDSGEEDPQEISKIISMSVYPSVTLPHGKCADSQPVGSRKHSFYGAH
jgi:hypothetical protein